jgi:hypothetical protein
MGPRRRRSGRASRQAKPRPLMQSGAEGPGSGHVRRLDFTSRSKPTRDAEAVFRVVRTSRQTKPRPSRGGSRRTGAREAPVRQRYAASQHRTRGVTRVGKWTAKAPTLGIGPEQEPDSSPSRQSAAGHHRAFSALLALIDSGVVLGDTSINSRERGASATAPTRVRTTYYGIASKAR